MKYLAKTSLLASAGLIIIVPMLFALFAVRQVGATGAASVYLSSTSSVVAQGGSLDINVYEDSGADQTNAADIILNYDSKLLAFAGIDATNSAFGVSAEGTGGNGTVTIARGSINRLTGPQLVASVNFTAIRGGTATINFAASTTIVSAVDNKAMMLTSTGGSYVITPSGSITLSPATKTVTQGSNFEVAVYENSLSDPVNGAQINLTYPTNLLTFVGVANSSAWPTDTQSGASNGVVKIVRGTTTPLTGSQLVATVTFTAAGTGNAQVGIYPDSGLIRSADSLIEPTNNTGGSYVITAPPAPSGGGGTSTPPAPKPAPPPKSVTVGVGSTPSTTGAPAVSKPVTSAVDNASPVISDITVTDLTSTSATINWMTSEPATSEVDYGLNTDFILSKSDATLTTNHTLALDPKVLAPHKTFHFVVKSADAAGNLATSEDQTFHTGGLYIQASKAEIVGGGAAVIVGGGLVVAKIAGLFKFGAMTAAGGGIYSAPKATGKAPPKPIIVGGGAPPPPPQPVIKPQAANPTASAPKVGGSQAPGEVIAPKTPPK